jgi:atrial natriuretic peptide receptor A
LADLFNDFQATHTALLQMLPEHVIETLNRGKRVIPEEFDAVTILFSDIIGFTEIAAKVHPLLIVKLLNQLYTVMDHCATYFPLFKVETIGDAYMIVISYNTSTINQSINYLINNINNNIIINNI